MLPTKPLNDILAAVGGAQANDIVTLTANNKKTNVLGISKQTAAPMWDDFDRSDRVLNGDTLPTGQTWQTTGTGYLTVGIVGRRVMEPTRQNFYAFADYGAPVSQFNADFSLAAEGVDNGCTQFVMHLAADMTLLNMLHLQISKFGWSLDKRIAGVWGNSILTRQRGISARPGNVYRMSIRVVGTTVTIIDVDGVETSVVVADLGTMGTLRFIGIQYGNCHGVSTGICEPGRAGLEVETREISAMRRDSYEKTIVGPGWVRVATRSTDFATFTLSGEWEIYAQEYLIAGYGNRSAFRFYSEGNRFGYLRRMFGYGTFGGAVTQARISFNSATLEIALDLYFARASSTTLRAKMIGGFTLVETPVVGAVALATESHVIDLVDPMGFDSGVPISATVAAALNFGSIAAGDQADLTIAVPGAAVGDSVVLGLPAAPAAKIAFNAFVSAADVVTVRASNVDLLAAVDPANATYRVTVLK